MTARQLVIDRAVVQREFVTAARRAARARQRREAARRLRKLRAQGANRKDNDR